MGEELRFDKSALYGEDLVRCSCGFLQFLGFHCRISKTLHPGSYVRMRSTDIEVDIQEETTSLLVKEKEVEKPSPKRNIKAWIKRRINRTQNKKQKVYPGTAQLSRTNSIHRSKFNRTGESIKELGRTILDGLLHRIPYGQKVPEEMIKGKLSRSLSADYDAYTKKEKKSTGVSLKPNHNSNKFRRIHSSPASVSVKRSSDAIDVKREEEAALLNAYQEKDAKCEMLESVQENETGEHGENLVCKILESKEDATDGGLTSNLVFQKAVEERSEKTENGSVPTEIKDADTTESNELRADFAQKDLCIDSKELESVTNLLKQLGFDASLGVDEETTESKTEQDDEVSLEEFKRAWDQINKVEFAKFDCNLLPQDLILVLDLIDQAYQEAYTNYSSSTVWFSSNFSKFSPKTIENHVLKEVQERVTWHLKAQEECGDEADELVAWDFERYDGWLDYRADFDKIVVELERLVFDDLVEGLVVEDSVDLSLPSN